MGYWKKLLMHQIWRYFPFSLESFNSFLKHRENTEEISSSRRRWTFVDTGRGRVLYWWKSRSDLVEFLYQSFKNLHFLGWVKMRSFTLSLDERFNLMLNYIGKRASESCKVLVAHFHSPCNIFCGTKFVK